MAEVTESNSASRVLAYAAAEHEIGSGDERGFR